VVTFAGLQLTLGPTEQATLVETDRRLTLPKLELESQFLFKEDPERRRVLIYVLEKKPEVLHKNQRFSSARLCLQ
jgi:hypothetical protein